MAELRLFHYTPKNTVLHRLDPRFKTLFVLLAVLCAISGRPSQLAGLSLYLLGMLLLGRVAVWRYGRELRVFAVLGLLIFLPHAISGDTAGGAVAAWRFLAVVISGLLFTAITAPRELHSTVQWLLRPLPGIREGAVATHISLTLMFIPLMFDTFAEVREARKARFAEGIRNPISRIRGLAAPLLEKLLQQIDEVSYALESRCYHENAQRASFPGERGTARRALLLLLPYLLLLLLPSFLPW